jgi:Flp pilus assembly protein TadB
MDDPPDIKLWVAYIAAAASLLTALINVLLTRASERKRREHEGRMAAQKEQHDKIIERLRSELGGQLKQVEAQLEDQNAERNARRDYEYEARKRVYQEVEPILFQLAELAEGGLHRIYSLARTARHGDLAPQRRGWAVPARVTTTIIRLPTTFSRPLLR